jgi:alpha-1,2-mannosyltransferase
MIVAGMTILSGAILLVQALAHGHLSGLDEYDDGVYFGSAMQLVHGIMPYRDFGFIQPPFIAVVLSPFALASHFVGTARAFEGARLFIVAIATANTALVGLLLRRRPVAEMIVAMGVMAVYPGAVSSAQTVLLEPVMVCLTLLACVAIFDGGDFTASRRRAIVAGLLLGVAASTKIWAFGPALVVSYLLWRCDRRRQFSRRAERFLLGLAAGFWLICLPFFFGAPQSFLRQVFVTQAVRSGGGYAFEERLVDLSGVAGPTHVVAPTSTLGGAMVGVCLIGLLAFMAYRRAGRPLGDLEQVALLCAFGVATFLALSPTYYYHYSGFEAPFLALSAGFVSGRLAEPLPRWTTP